MRILPLALSQFANKSRDLLLVLNKQLFLLVPSISVSSGNRFVVVYIFKNYTYLFISQ